MPPKVILARPRFQTRPDDGQFPTLDGPQQQQLQQQQQQPLLPQLPQLPQQGPRPALVLIPTPASSPASSSPTLSSAVTSPPPPTSAGARGAPAEDDDCDLCNERVPPGMATPHRLLEHGALLAWCDAQLASPRPARAHPGTLDTLGALAVDLAAGKDGGLVAWRAVINVWRQLRSAVRHRTLELRVFGSCIAMGSWDGQGDIDLSFVRPCPVPDPAKAAVTAAAAASRADEDRGDESEYVRAPSAAAAVAAAATAALPPPPAYEFMSVADEAREVMFVARKLREAGFAFDDLEPVVRTRVPIVKHKHRAPGKERAWNVIADTEAARTLILRFRRAAPPQVAEIMTRGFGHIGRWTSGRVEFTIVARDTCQAVDLYTDMWGAVRAAARDVAEPALRADVAAADQAAKQAAAALAAAAAAAASAPAAAEDATGAAPPPPPPSHLVAAARAAEGRALEARRLLQQVEGIHRSQWEDAFARAAYASNRYFEFPEMFHADFDLSFRAYGIRNSLLLRAYFSQTPLARVGALLIKQWSKETAINLSMRGYWTTYCVNIVWIAFLLQRGVVKFVDPRDIPVAMTDADFETLYLRHIPVLGGAEPDTLRGTVGALLFDFFVYYGFEFDWQREVVTLRQPRPFTRDTVSTAKRAWVHDNEERTGKFRDRVWYRMCIDDPYEENLSLGRHLSPNKAGRVLAHFRAMATRLASPVPPPPQPADGGDADAAAAAAAAAAHVKAWLLPSLTPEQIAPDMMRASLVRWMVGHRVLPLAALLSSLTERERLFLAAGNGFSSLTALLLPANLVLRIDDANNGVIEHSSPQATFLSTEVYAALQEVERRVRDSPTGELAVSQALAKQLGLAGNYVAPLRQYFAFTDLARGSELRVFRSREALDAFRSAPPAQPQAAAVAAMRSATALPVPHSAAAAATATGGGEPAVGEQPPAPPVYAVPVAAVKQQRDLTRSFVGTCDECGKRQHRVFAAQGPSPGRERYCVSCWDAYDRS